MWAIGVVGASSSVAVAKVDGGFWLMAEAPVAVRGLPAWWLLGTLALGRAVGVTDFGKKVKMSSPDDNGSDDELRKTISQNETHAEWGGAAVIFGLIIEVVLTSTYRHGESIIEGWGPVFADALIALAQLESGLLV